MTNGLSSVVKALWACWVLRVGFPPKLRDHAHRLIKKLKIASRYHDAKCYVHGAKPFPKNHHLKPPLAYLGKRTYVSYTWYLLCITRNFFPLLKKPPLKTFFDMGKSYRAKTNPIMLWTAPWWRNTMVRARRPSNHEPMRGQSITEDTHVWF